MVAEGTGSSFSILPSSVLSRSAKITLRRGMLERQQKTHCPEVVWDLDLSPKKLFCLKKHIQTKTWTKAATQRKLMRNVSWLKLGVQDRHFCHHSSMYALQDRNSRFFQPEQNTFSQWSCSNQHHVALKTFADLLRLLAPLWCEECMVNISSLVWTALISTRLSTFQRPGQWIGIGESDAPVAELSGGFKPFLLWQRATAILRKWLNYQPGTLQNCSPIIWAEFDHPNLGPNCIPVGCMDFQPDSINRFTFTSQAWGEDCHTML